ncbi:MAG: hypothetical protein IJG50_06615 [Clostridia bacterium]|nr:hypothetical protein [Clostridia bacterium]
MSALKIKMLSLRAAGTAYIRVKKAAEHLCDENFVFDFLPRVSSIYEESDKGRLLREKAFTDKCDLLVVFFYPHAFNASMMILLEAMEYFDRVIIVSDASFECAFDISAFSQCMCIDAKECDGSAGSVVDTLGFIRTYGASLLYSSPSYINYGPDAECALSIISYDAEKAFTAKQKRWAASRLLRGGSFIRELFMLFNIDGQKKDVLFRDIKKAEEYLERCVPSIKFSTYADEVFESITNCIKCSSLSVDAQNEDTPETRSIFICAMILYVLFSLTCAVILLID